MSHRVIKWKCPIPVEEGQRAVHSYGPGGQDACNTKWDGLGYNCTNPLHWKAVPKDQCRDCEGSGTYELDADLKCPDCLGTGKTLSRKP